MRLFGCKSSCSSQISRTDIHERLKASVGALIAFLKNIDNSGPENTGEVRDATLFDPMALVRRHYARSWLV
jgi:hypothetical protein